ncbi:MAG: STAS domain-containing protein [Deltaproteobacteria bacterium]|nr:STAS domain-containing protein [Deltaproteobacteria bacterium]
MKVISIKEYGNLTIIQVHGRLDTVTSAQFEHDIQPIIDNKDFIAADFSKCPYLSSSGIRSLLITAKILAQRKGSLIIFGMPAGMVQVIEVAGLQNIFHIVDTEEQAVAWIEKHRQSASFSSSMEFDEITYDISLLKNEGITARIWHRQGLAAYNELGLAFGIGRIDENTDLTGMFLTTFNSAIFLPDDKDLTCDFRLSHHPSQTGIMVAEAVSFGHTPTCQITTRRADPIPFEQMLGHIEKIIAHYFPESKLASFILFNYDQDEPSVITGLLTRGLDRELTDHPFELINHPFFRASDRQAGCFEYRLAGLDRSMDGNDPVNQLNEAMTFENIIEARATGYLISVTLPVAWLFTANQTEDATIQRIRIDSPEGFEHPPQKPFLTRRLYADSSRLVVKALHGGYAAQTFQVESFDQQGRKLRPTVLKIGPGEMITREAERCRKYALPFIMNNSAMVLGTELCGDIGALRYNFVGISGEETRLKWLTQLFQEWPVDRLEPLFDKIFLQILKPWYGQSAKGTIHPFREHDPSLTFFPHIFEKAETFSGVSCDDPEAMLQKTGVKIFNPYWYLKHRYPELRETTVDYYTSICHGDLNMRNILLDDNMNVYLIDFSETMPRSAVSDFARLEAIFMIESMPVDTKKELHESIQLLTEFYHAISLNESPEISYSGEKPELVNRCVVLSRKMRRYALASVEGNTDMIPYYFALIEWVLPIVCFSVPINRKVLSMVAASILLERISSFFHAPDTAERVLSLKRCIP